MRRIGTSVLLVLTVACCAALGAWLVPRTVGPATYTTSVGDLEMSVALTRTTQRGVDVYVPLADWGLRAAVTDAPVVLRAEPRRLDRAGLVRVVGEGEASVEGLRADLDAALRSLARRTALLVLAGVLLGGLVAAAIWRALGVRGRRLGLAPVAAVALALLGGGALAGWAYATFDADKLDQPRFYASGVEIERIVDQAEALRASSEKYSRRVDNALRAISGLLDTDLVKPATDGSRRPTRRLVLASDVHNNLLTLPALKGYANGAPVALVGDFTINGGALEAPLASRMARVSKTVVAVSGNHDSPGIMRSIERAGATVLERSDGVRDIGGIAMAGFEDPLAYDEGEFPAGIRAGMSFPDIEGGDRLLQEAKDERWKWWQKLPSRPQMLLMHQQSLALDLAQRIMTEDPAGPPLTILTGHTHRQRIERFGPVTVVNSGTIGAGGVWGVGEQSVGLALLDLTGAEDRHEATTLIAENPVTRSAQARRVITSQPDCDDRVVFCTP